MQKNLEKLMINTHYIRVDDGIVSWIDYRLFKMPKDFSDFKLIFPNYVISKINTKLLNNNKKEEIVTYYLLKNSLEKYFGEYISEISLNQYGKPYFLDKPYIHFNISHSNGFSACFISLTRPIGVDIQTIVKYTHEFDIVLHKNEIELINNETLIKNKNTLFTIIWSAKEAYLKCQGTGITNNMKKMNFVNVVNNCQEFNGIKIYIKEFNNHILTYACKC